MPFAQAGEKLKHEIDVADSDAEDDDDDDSDDEESEGEDGMQGARGLDPLSFFLSLNAAMHARARHNCVSSAAISLFPAQTSTRRSRTSSRG